MLDPPDEVVADAAAGSDSLPPPSLKRSRFGGGTGLASLAAAAAGVDLSADLASALWAPPLVAVASLLEPPTPLLERLGVVEVAFLDPPVFFSPPDFFSPPLFFSAGAALLLRLLLLLASFFSALGGRSLRSLAGLFDDVGRDDGPLFFPEVLAVVVSSLELVRPRLGGAGGLRLALFLVDFSFSFCSFSFFLASFAAASSSAFFFFAASSFSNLAFFFSSASFFSAASAYSTHTRAKNRKGKKFHNLLG